MDTETDNYMTEQQLEESYTEMLDDTTPWADVAGMVFSPSQVLKNCDPIAYRVYLADYADNLLRDDDTLIIENYSS